MSKIISIRVGRLGMIAAMCGIAWLLARSAPHPTPAESITVDPAALSFGEVWVQSDLLHDLPIRCTSLSRVTIESFTVSCGCTQVEPSSLVLMPGDTKTLHLRIDLGSVPPGANQWARPVRVKILPVVSGETAPVGPWHLQGIVKYPLLVRPHTILLPERGEGTSVPQIASFEIDLAPGVSNVTAACDARFGTITVDRSGQDIVAPFTLKDEEILGPFAIPVRFTPTTSSNQVLPPVAAVVEGVIRPDLYAIPEQVTLGLVEAGSVIHEDIQLRSRSHRDFEVTDIELPRGTQAIAVESPQHRPAFALEHAVVTPSHTKPTVVFHCRYKDDSTQRLVRVPITYALRSD